MSTQMNAYLLLFIAIIFEVLGTLMLPSSQNFTKTLPTIVCLLSYSTSFYLLSIISQKLPLAIIYASWSGLGLFFITILSFMIYHQAINYPTAFGLFLIVAGVVIVNVFKPTMS